MRELDSAARARLLVALGLLVCAAFIELIAFATAPSDAVCTEVSTARWLVIFLVLSVPVLWVVGLGALAWASRNRGVSASRWSSVGFLTLVVVGLLFLPALVLQFGDLGCVT